ncbi:MAG TPA: exosortase F system-associated protein [Flavobacteriaceae bacterium]|nr:exosortase F system-associated protein [Flavobacteriaceae bacterium]
MAIWQKIILIGILFLGMVTIRFFETQLFYDPLIHFYEGSYLTQPPPQFEEWKLILNTFFRFCLNTILSLLILFVAFRCRKIMKFSILFFGAACLLLMILFVYLVFNMAPENYFTLFYVRRFLIQPIFIILLLPAFYYQKALKK